MSTEEVTESAEEAAADAEDGEWDEDEQVTALMHPTCCRARPPFSCIHSQDTMVALGLPDPEGCSFSWKPQCLFEPPCLHARR